MGVDMVILVCYSDTVKRTTRGGKDIARKTTTSTDVKRRYNEKVYTQISANVPKDIAAAFKKKCESAGVSQRSVIIEAIEKFLKG